MATNAIHLKLLAGAGFVAAIAIGAGCAFGRNTTASVTTEDGARVHISARTVASPGGPTPPKDPCPLRFPDPLPSRTRAVPILMYHRIDYITASTPDTTRRLTVSPVVFRHQMRWLTDHHFRAITQRQLFDALMCGSRLPRRRVLITFDDGYRDVYRYAAPVLERRGLPATEYVITGRISGGDHSFLTWPQLHLLEREGVEIGSHTVSQVGLTTLSDTAALSELVRSRVVLERKLGHRVPWLAYPYGAYDSRIEGLARRAGYLLATTTVPGVFQNAIQPLALRRLRILDSTGVGGLAAMLGEVR